MGESVSPCLGHFAQLGLVVCHAAARAAQRERGPHDHRIADLPRHGHGLFHARSDARRDDRAGRFRAWFQQRACGPRPCRWPSAPVPSRRTPCAFKNAFPLQLRWRWSAPSARPAPASRPSGFSFSMIRAARYPQPAVPDRFHRPAPDPVMIVAGLELHQHHVHAHVLEHAAGLRARIVEFGRLPDHDRAGADDQHLVDTRYRAAFLSPLSSSQEFIEQEPGIARAAVQPPDGTAC